MTTIREQRTQRRNQTAEIFTPHPLVEKMLNLFPRSIWKAGKTFLDPACGNGNMLVCVLQRKLALGHDPIQALQSVYGTDIMGDNIREARLRLLKVVSLKTKVTRRMVEAVFTNVICTPLEKFPRGSLDYDFSFPPAKSERTVEAWARGIRGLLEKVEVEGGLVHSLEEIDEGPEDSGVVEPDPFMLDFAQEPIKKHLARKYRRRQTEKDEPCLPF